MKTLVCLFALVFVASPLFADGMRNRVKIKKRSQMTRADADNSEAYNTEKMKVLADKRRSLISDIKRFLREARNEDQKAELNLRLGSLFMEDYRGNLGKAQVVFDEQTKIFEQRKVKGAKPPKFDPSEAYESLDKARMIYKDLITRYPNHPRRDEMLYFMAISSIDRGKIPEGMNYFRKLNQETPDSPYVNESLIQLGDHHFENNEFPTAEAYYDALIKRKYKPLLAYAVYKKAWCAYNGQRPAVALSHFKWVVTYEDEEHASAAARVKSEALKDIALPFWELRQINDAVAFFRNAGDPHYRRGIETIAQLAFESGEHKISIPLYELLLGMDATYPQNPRYEISIVNALKLSNAQEASVQRLFQRMPLYLESSNWHEINAANANVIAEANKTFEDATRTFAIQYHAEGQKLKNETLYNLAKLLYGKYIESFRSSPQLAKMRFNYAEILFKQSQWVPSSDNYWAVYRDPNAGTLKYDAIRYSLTALDRQLNAERKQQGLGELNTKAGAKLKAKQEETLQEVPYSDVETKFITISEEYLDKYPTAKDAADVLYVQAYLHYLHHDLIKAYKSFWNLVQKYPSHTTAYASANLILDILNRKKDYPKLILACKKFLNTQSFNKPEFRKDIADVLRRAELKRIALMEEKGEYKLAADQYIEYTKEYGAQDEALFEKAMYNAGVNYSKASLYLAAVETQEKFLRRFQKSPLRENLLLQVAKSHEALANFEKAAFYFDMFAQQYPANAQAKAAWRISALYYWGSNNVKKSEALMLAFIQRFPKESRMVERDLVDFYETLGATEKLVAYFTKARSERGVAAIDHVSYTVRIAEIVASKNSGRLPEKMMVETLKTAQKYSKEILANPKGIEVMSKLMFWYTNQREQMYHGIKLALPQNQLEQNLQRKLGLLKEIEKEYGRIVGLGSGDWGLASIYRTAVLYRGMAIEIQQAPVPSELTAEQIELYRAELNKQLIKPFNEKSLALAQQCVDKANEFNLLSGWTPKCYGLAGELDAARYPLVRTMFLPSMQLAMVMPAKKDTRLQTGNIKTYGYPFYSVGMFQNEAERQTASTDTDLPALYEGPKQGAGGQAVQPMPLSYRVLAEERKETLRKYLDEEKPADLRKGVTFSFMNLLRLNQPQRALPLIIEAIQKDPNNAALHNLLGLTNVELGNVTAAKITWLSLLARGVKDPAVVNNLGVIAMMEGRENSAINYFIDASSVTQDATKEPFNNLGFIALKYRNGFDAKKQFEASQKLDEDDVSSRVGFTVAQLQNREMENAKDGLVTLAKKFRNDPYARLSLGYYLIDVEQEHEVARKILSEFVEQNNVDTDLAFRQAMQAAKSATTGGMELPDALPGIQEAN